MVALSDLKAGTTIRANHVNDLITISIDQNDMNSSKRHSDQLHLDYNRLFVLYQYTWIGKFFTTCENSVDVQQTRGNWAVLICGYLMGKKKEKKQLKNKKYQKTKKPKKQTITVTFYCLSSDCVTYRLFFKKPYRLFDLRKKIVI